MLTRDDTNLHTPTLSSSQTKVVHINRINIKLAQSLVEILNRTKSQTSTRNYNLENHTAWQSKIIRGAGEKIGRSSGPTKTKS